MDGPRGQNLELEWQREAQVNLALRSASSLTQALKPAWHPILVMGYPGHLAWLLEHLAKSALDAVPRGGRLQIEAGGELGGVRIIFRDTGEGVAPEVLPHIFVPGFRTRSARGGAGLGQLACKQSVEAHGRTRRVSSERGRGSTFAVEFPREPALE